MDKRLVILALVEILGVLCLGHLWYRSAPLWKKLMWTPVVLFPAIGPMLYGGMFSAPSVHSQSDGAPVAE